MIQIAAREISGETKILLLQTTAMGATEKVFRQLTDEEKQAYKRLCVASSSKDRGRCQPSWKKLASVIADRDDVPIAPELVSRIVDLSDEKARSMQELFTHIKEYSALEAKAEPDPFVFQKEAWKVDYVGKSDRLLRSAISSMYKQSLAENLPWKNFCAIIQGSGTGKSRLVDKLAESVFTIPLVLRPHDDKTGYPQGDTSGGLNLLTFFCGIFSSVDKANRTYLLFMLNMVSYVDDWIDGYLKEGHGTASIAADWRNHLGPPGSPNRIRMFDRAKSGSIPKGFEELWNIHEVEIFFRAIAKKVNHNTRINPLFVFYFDEAHHLTNYMVKSKRTAYQCLCNVMTYMLRAPVFGLFISTFSRLSQFSPRPRNFWSSRLLKASDEGSDDDMHAPFVELPFDLWKQASIVVEGAHTDDEICSLPFMARFGRPLFWTLLEAKAGPAQVMEMAMSKLRLRFENQGNYDSSDVNLDNIKSPQLIPLLAVRVDFTFASNRDEAVYLERLLVASSMRTVYSVPQHREYLRGGYPSEPFLAEAAARMMFDRFEFKKESIEAVIKQYEHDVPTAVQQWFSRGLIERGQRGELVARLLCTLAHDIAILKTVKGLSRSISFSEMVPVVDFLKALIATDLIGNVLDTEPAYGEKKPLKEAFENSYVHFTQFVKAGHKSIITEEIAYFLFTRGSAIQGYGNLVIPVWIKGKGNPDRSSMSAIFIQVKNRLNEQDILHDAVEDFEFFREPVGVQEDNRAYITIAMQLGIPESDKDSSLQPQRFSSPGDEKPHPCYELSLNGCSSDVYNVIDTRKGEVTYSGILAASGGILPEHPRQKKEFLDSVKRMKPLWEPEFEYFNWVEANRECRVQTLVGDEVEDQGDVEMEIKDENTSDNSDSHCETIWAIFN
ncbi:hypothetical protein AGABI2DRAFT_179180 [Agaricus bisporus var. bisporus H97]|uniref:hypothetical protein n=1 Tax=Agaricus bisporus var. bisporus (strain H97 / ATCC MYA-4626 / FGSC 10389) TaxID=936046 RepID=UPI00029F5DD9|nr:hypothetical protein AGABI2DRAFT_179180 [Agaricus bisporus var. bisporus H97]EKV45621.1 hypothetical protein AGABI2DRAFT_179180 [Agaricus bisporus var. bisporus H97]